jgi:mono/diheme cytochrome c family protein
MKKGIALAALAVTSVLSFTFFQTDDRLAESVKRGESIYQANCMSCHMTEGEGLEGVFPPLANTGRLSDNARLVQIVVNGLQGRLTVNGKEYDSEMFPISLNNKEIADVLNYVRNSWKNKATIIEEDDVRKLRESVK